MLSLSAFAVLLLTVCAPCVSNGHIKINNQSEFDKLGQTIIQRLSSCETDIRVSLAPGTYYYVENHLDFSGRQYSDAQISITGSKTTLVAAGKRYAKGDSFGDFSPKRALLDGEGNVINIWSPFFQLDEQIEVVSSTMKQCRLKNLSKARRVSKAGSYIQITSWYVSYIYKVDKIEDGYIYFTANNLAAGFMSGWNINNDYNFAKKYPRYRLSNVEGRESPVFLDNWAFFSTDNSSALYECKATRFLVLGYGTKLKSVEINGLRFVGNAYNGEDGVMDFKSPDCSCVVKDCEFEGIYGSRVMSVGNKNNVSITGCTFTECYESCIISSHSSENTSITNNKFSNCGLGMMNSACVRCYGTNYYIGNNTFVNYGYSAIGLGYGAGNKHEHEISGIVEYNTLLYTDDYMVQLPQKTLMDGGAIYISTQNDNTTIRYNTIRNYSGMHENRGIYCDDGASNLKIYGNVVTGISNFHCIESRRVAAVESKSGPSNTGNVIRDNIVDGDILFVGREGGNNGCEYGTNYFLIDRNEDRPKNTVRNVNVDGEEVLLDYTGEARGQIGVSSKSYKVLKKSKTWKQVKNGFVRKNQ